MPHGGAQREEPRIVGGLLRPHVGIAVAPRQRFPHSPKGRALHLQLKELQTCLRIEQAHVGIAVAMRQRLAHLPEDRALHLHGITLMISKQASAETACDTRESSTQQGGGGGGCF